MKRSNRRGALQLILGCAAIIGLASVIPVSTAAYTDQTSAQTSGSVSPITTKTAIMRPTNTYIANTMTVLQDDGTLWVWGFRGNGLSGTGVASVTSSAAPSAVVLPNTGYAGTGGRRYITKVAATSLDNYFPTDPIYTTMAALSDDGLVYTWGGNNQANTLGRANTPTSYNSPGQVAISGTVVDLKSSAGVFMALTSTGDLYTWGYPQGRGITGQGGLSSSGTVPVRILTGVHSIGAGTWNGWAIVGNYSSTSNATGVFWWGWANAGNSFASDPSGDNLGTIRSAPTRSATLSPYAVSGCATVGVVMGSAADSCSIRSLTGHYFGNQMLLSNGQLYGWGDAGNFGTGRPSNNANLSATPRLVAVPDNDPITKVAVTEDYVILLGATATVYIYGRYSFADGPDPVTGNISTTDITRPQRITALGNTIVDIGGFGYSGVALRADRTLISWGGSDQGGSNNTYSSIRNGWITNSAPTGSTRGLTTLTTPGS